MLSMFTVLAYFSPETMLPLSSLIATVVGFGLLIKRSTLRFVVHCCRSAFRGRSAGTGPNSPHFARKTDAVQDKTPS